MYPVIVGAGKRLFAGTTSKQNLRLVEGTKTFGDGIACSSSRGLARYGAALPGRARARTALARRRPGQTPVAREKPVAPGRSTADFHPPEYRALNGGGERASAQPRSAAGGFGALPWRATSFPRALERAHRPADRGDRGAMPIGRYASRRKRGQFAGGSVVG